ncbi:MAG TPA: radical SAM protein [Thermoanaerobaculia bacterium]|jgi:MoaA/NifB/PqqE/SkfB family radical SAM enzyme|nr:radical SAM protein [Thermoanaerobaculia bacterium]
MTQLSQAARFRTFGAEGAKDALRAFLLERLALTDADYDAIVKYLQTRAAEVRGKDTFGIVYDITRVCNLECAHCCVSAIFKRDPGDAKFETTTDQVFTILDKVHAYTSSKGFPNVFLIFGGGEPTIRPDFPEVAQHAHELFGVAGVGINSNGTTLNVDQLLALSEHLGFIEISIDGFESYHNAWRDPKTRTMFDSPYAKTLGLVLDALKYEELAEKIEVSSAVTTENINDLRAFAEHLASLGVRQYSVHRAMPVGRMGLRFDRIPSMEQYARLLIDVAWLRANTPLTTLHLHHSLETIYSVLFLGHDIHASELLTGSGRHSIGLDPQGNVYFDPWCVVPPFNRLAAGNLLTDGSTLKEIVETEGSLIRIADEYAKQEVRCNGCRMKCSGGMRFNALGHFLFSRFGNKINDATVPDMVAGMSEIDPACPLYEA